MSLFALFLENVGSSEKNVQKVKSPTTLHEKMNVSKILGGIDFWMKDNRRCEFNVSDERESTPHAILKTKNNTPKILANRRIDKENARQYYFGRFN